MHTPGKCFRNTRISLPVSFSIDFTEIGFIVGAISSKGLINKIIVRITAKGRFVLDTPYFLDLLLIIITVVEWTVYGMSFFSIHNLHLSYFVLIL